MLSHTVITFYCGKITSNIVFIVYYNIIKIMHKVLKAVSLHNLIKRRVNYMRETVIYLKLVLILVVLVVQRQREYANKIARTHQIISTIVTKCTVGIGVSFLF